MSDNVIDIEGYLAKKAVEAGIEAPEEKLQEIPKTVIEKILDDKDEQFGTQREAIRDKLKEANDPLQKAFDELTPEQRLAGNVSALLIDAHGRSDIDRAFTWAEIEQKRLGWELPENPWYWRCLVVLQAAQTIGVSTPAGMRGVRKLYFIATRDFVEPPIEDISTMSAIQRLQKKACRLLMSAKSNEDVEKVWAWVETETGRGLRDADKCVAFFQVAQMAEYNESKFTDMVNIYLKMLNK